MPRLERQRIFERLQLNTLFAEPAQGGREIDEKGWIPGVSLDGALEKSARDDSAPAVELLHALRIKYQRMIRLHGFRLGQQALGLVTLSGGHGALGLLN
jgi:hypothetical protein